MMRKGTLAKLEVKLPEGYDLYRDAAGMCLYTENELVQMFSYAASPYVTKTTALRHMRGKEAASNA